MICYSRNCGILRMKMCFQQFCYSAKIRLAGIDRSNHLVWAILIFFKLTYVNLFYTLHAEILCITCTIHMFTKCVYQLIINYLCNMFQIHLRRRKTKKFVKKCFIMTLPKHFRGLCAMAKPNSNVFQCRKS